MATYQQQTNFQVMKQINDSKSLKSGNFCSIFFKISRFYQQKNRLITVVILSFKYLLPFILLIKDLPISQKTTVEPQMKKLFIQYSAPFHTLITINKLLINGSIFTLCQETFYSNFAITEINRFFKTKQRGLIEIDFHISMLLMSFDMLLYLPNFLLSLFIYIFACIFLENYINKQDLFYCASSKTNMFYRILIILGYIMVAFLFNSTSNQGILKVGISLYVIVLVIWFNLQGCMMFPNELINKGMVGCISMLITANILIIQKHFLGGSQTFLFYSIKIIITFTIIFLTCFLIMQKRNQRRCNKQDYHISQIKNILNTLFTNETTTEKIAFIYARIQLHQQRCQNLNCETHTFDLYNQKIATNGESLGICAMLKSYFRCLYQEHLNNSSSDSCLLEYLEYLYSQKNPNHYKMAIFLSKINKQRLSIFQLSSLWSLKLSTEKLFKNKIGELYNGKLNFEQTLVFDQKYKIIQSQINYLIKSNIQIYKHLEKRQIDLNLVFKIISNNLKIQKSLSKQWQAVSNSLKHQKDLTIAYFYYKQLIKNQRLKRHDFQLTSIQQLRNTYEESIFLNENYFNPAIILHKETIVFTCTLLDKCLVFKEVNHNFQYFIGYNREQVIMQNLDHILNYDLKQTHEESFKSWMDGNLKSSLQSESYQFKKTECLTKDKVVLPVLKYFKSYLNSNLQLQFVCMLKVNRKEINCIKDQFDQSFEASEKINNLQQKRISLALKKDQQIIQFTNDYGIFIKEQQFQPNQSSGDIYIIKIKIVIFFFLASASLIAFHYFTAIHTSILQSYSQKYITFMQCYRFPMILGNSYLQSILGVGNQTIISNQIDKWRSSFAALASNPTIMQTLYDVDINIPESYFPYRNGSLIMDYSEKLDQIQIFNIILSSVTSLRAPINPQSQDFIKFDQFITPSYDNMLNSTKLEFHQSFIDYINSFIHNQIIIGVIQIIIGVIFITIIINSIRLFIVKMRFISDTIVNYKKEDLQKIIHYWINIDFKFRSIFASYTRKQSISNQRSIQSQIQVKQSGQQQQFVNRTNKTIKQSKNHLKFIKISIVSIILGTFIVAAAFSATEMNRITRLKYLIYFENEGFLFLRYFPVATIVGYGCNQKYLSIKNPQVFFSPSRFDFSISSMRLVGNFSYIPEVKNNESPYFRKQKNYFFGNPCRYNPNIIDNIGVSIATCESIINGSFSRGLTSYMREGSNRADLFLKGITTMNAAQLSQFSLSVSVLSGYILDAISTWGTEFNQILVSFVSQQTIFTLINFCVLILVFILIFWLFFIRFLQKEYQFYRYMFMKMIPEYILKTDKVARQAFINFNILEQK